MCPVSEIILMKESIHMCRYWKYITEGRLGEQNRPFTLSHWKYWFLCGCCLFCFVLWALLFAEFGDSRQEEIKCNGHIYKQRCKEVNASEQVNMHELHRRKCLQFTGNYRRKGALKVRSSVFYRY